jgi:hypothetical protein
MSLTSWIQLQIRKSVYTCEGVGGVDLAGGDG